MRLIDQRALPARLRFVVCADVDDAHRRDRDARGARRARARRGRRVRRRARRAHAADEAPGARRGRGAIARARPTAVNLAWGVARAARRVRTRWPRRGARRGARRSRPTTSAATGCIGAHGASLVPVGGAVLTHCNTGALACVGYGTALGVVRAAFEAGREPPVWVDETRPLLQGARLTMWECDRLGIDATLVADGAAAVADGPGHGRPRDRRRRPHRRERRRREQDRHVRPRASRRVITRSRSTSPRPRRRSISRPRPATAIVIEERDPDEVTHVGLAPRRARGRRGVQPGVRRHARPGS